MKGLMIKFKGETKNIIKDLLRGIDLSNYSIDLGHWDAYDDTMDFEIDFNDLGLIKSEKIVNAIFSENSTIRPEFMQLFIKDRGKTSSKVLTYEDFLNSNYQLIMTSTDYSNMIVVSKSALLLETIKNNFIQLEVKEKIVKELININLKGSLDAWRFGEKL